MSPERPAAGPDFLNTAEVCALLRISRPTLYGAIARGEVPGVLRLGRVLRFSRAALVGSEGVQACASRSIGGNR